VLVTQLREGQRVTVLQLPVQPVEMPAKAPEREYPVRPITAG
jgi:hypothetical protein